MFIDIKICWLQFLAASQQTYFCYFYYLLINLSVSFVRRFFFLSIHYHVVTLKELIKLNETSSFAME